MTLRKSKLINLPVYTNSGEQLGKISDFEFDPSTQTIVRYYVRSGTLLREIVQRELIISREQLVVVTEEKMVVVDSVVPEKAMKEPLKKAVPIT